MNISEKSVYVGRELGGRGRALDYLNIQSIQGVFEMLKALDMDGEVWVVMFFNV